MLESIADSMFDSIIDASQTKSNSSHSP